MKTMRLVLLALVLAMAGTTAYARDSVNFSLSFGYPAYYSPPPVVYYSPPPVYYAPAPAYYHYYGPRVYYHYDEPRFRHDHRHWNKHQRHDHRRHGHHRSHR